MMSIDSYHAGDTLMRSSITGFMIYMNISLISFLSRKLCTIDRCVFDVKFITMKQGVVHRVQKVDDWGIHIRTHACVWLQHTDHP